MQLHDASEISPSKCNHTYTHLIGLPSSPTGRWLAVMHFFPLRVRKLSLQLDVSDALTLLLNNAPLPFQTLYVPAAATHTYALAQRRSAHLECCSAITHRRIKCVQRDSWWLLMSVGVGLGGDDCGWRQLDSLSVYVVRRSCTWEIPKRFLFLANVALRCSEDWRSTCGLVWRAGMFKFSVVVNSYNYFLKKCSLL